MTEPLTMAGGASRSVKFLHLTTILAPERDLLRSFSRTTYEGEAQEKYTTVRRCQPPNLLFSNLLLEALG